MQCAYSPEIAAEVKAGREQRFEKADAWIKQVRYRLAHPSNKGRKPTPQGTYDRIRDYLRDRHLLRFYNVELTATGKLSVTKNAKTGAWEENIDGMLMLGTTDMARPPAEVVKRYKELAEIERGWRSLKSTLVVRPVCHWTEKRIRAHVFICVLALQIERWMRNRLKGISSVPKAVGILRRVKTGELEMGGKRKKVVTKASLEQKELIKTLGVPSLPTIIM